MNAATTQLSTTSNDERGVPMNDFQVRIGSQYPKDDTTLRIIATHGDDVLIEQWYNGVVMQYIVASQLYPRDGELHWKGSGKYFTCYFEPPMCDTPFDALGKALEYMRGPKTAYVLMTYDAYGTRTTSMHSTREEAEDRMQSFLDADEDLQRIASEHGTGALTVKSYFDTVEQLAEDYFALLDGYRIEELTVPYA